MSPKSTSAMSPSDTTCEKPMLRPHAQSMMAVISAPDCDRKARSPASGGLCEKLALRPMPGTIRPRQLGPWMRSRCGRAASSMARFRSSRIPAVMTTAARVPLAPSSAISAGMVAGGVTSTARSGAAGSDATEGWQACPSMAPYFGLTSQTGPANPPPSRFRAVMSPTLPGLVLAPISATDRGRSRKSKLRMVMAPRVPLLPVSGRSAPGQASPWPAAASRPVRHLHRASPTPATRRRCPRSAAGQRTPASHPRRHCGAPPRARRVRRRPPSATGRGTVRHSSDATASIAERSSGLACTASTMTDCPAASARRAFRHCRS